MNPLHRLIRYMAVVFIPCIVTGCGVSRSEYVESMVKMPTEEVRSYKRVLVFKDYGIQVEPYNRLQKYYRAETCFSGPLIDTTEHALYSGQFKVLLAIQP